MAWRMTRTRRKTLISTQVAAEEEEKYDAEQRLELKRRFAPTKERRVIAMALYGSDPKYVEGCIANAKLVEAYFPTWRLRVYADSSSVPSEKLRELEALKAEIHLDDWSAEGASHGMFRRFFVADDVSVDRFIIRDSDSRLNARDAFAVADWVESDYAVHTVRDHPNHQRLLNGGMWGATRHSKIAGRVEALARQYFDHDAYGADLDFLAADVAPLVEREVLAHDSYSCELFAGSRPFPTKRPADFQHVGQVFDARGRTRGDDIDSSHCDIIAAKYPGFHFLPRWPMAMKPFYIHHVPGENGSTGEQLSRGFDLNYGRDEMTSGGQREHNVDILEENLRSKGLNPEDFAFYTDGFRFGAPPHAGWGLGVARLLMVLTGSRNVRETVLFPRDRHRVTP